MSPLPPLNALASAPRMSPTMAGAAAPCDHPDPIDLSVGEPCVPPPQAVREAAAAAALAGNSRYGPAAGLPALRARVAHDLTRRDGLARSAEDVLITAGGKPAILDALRCLLEPGAEVLLFAPYWPSFLDQVRWAGGVPVIVAPGPDLLPAPEALERAISPRTRVLILNQPCNPSGLSWDAARIAELGRLAQRHGLWVIVDQVYGSLRFEAPERPFLRDLPELAAQTVLVESFSKRFAMTGYRLGAAAGPRRLLQAMTALGAASVTHPCTLSQHAGIAALSLDGTWEREHLATLRQRRDQAWAGLQGLRGVTAPLPQGGLYLFPEVSGWLQEHGALADTGLVTLLRTGAGIRLLPGSAFGMPGYLRLCFAAEEPVLAAALARLREQLS